MLPFWSTLRPRSSTATLESFSAVNASRSLRRASRYLTIASAVSSEEEETERSISTTLGLAMTVALPVTVKPSMLSSGPDMPEYGP